MFIIKSAQGASDVLCTITPLGTMAITNKVTTKMLTKQTRLYTDLHACMVVEDTLAGRLGC